MVTINIVSDLATPHNNCLVQAIRRVPKTRVVTWYAERVRSSQPWAGPLGGEVDNHYLNSGLSGLKLLGRALWRSDETFLLVGYSNGYTRFLMILFTLLRRPFLYWTDYSAEPGSAFRAVVRKGIYRVLNVSRSHILAVGERCVKRFVDSGFSVDRVTNLPIFIDIPPKPNGSPAVRERFGIGAGRRLLVAASRLSPEKGFDVLIKAIDLVEPALRGQLSVLIAGSGPEKERLEKLARCYGVGAQFIFVPWVEPDEYLRIVSAADVFVHPALFDAFGASIYAMALGVPVIGSDGAGAPLERISHGVNGLIFRRGDAKDLARCIAALLGNDGLREEIGRRARQTAERWPPERGANILLSVVRSMQSR